jgi:cysteine synthase A
MASRDCIGEDASSLIGNTPMIYLRRVVDPDCKAKVAVKLEYLNPACSVKGNLNNLNIFTFFYCTPNLNCVIDRIGYSMIQEAENAGKIRPGLTTLIEPSSGNTG